MCVPKLTKWSSDQAKSAAFENCGKLMTETACNPINECEWMKPEFSSYEEWKKIVAKAGLQGEVNDMPTGQYLEAAGKLWPDVKSKMANWMTQAEQRDPTKVDRGEFQSFRDYIHKVTEFGCVVDYKTFASYESKTAGTPPNYKE
jgi:hypothetical protein